MWVVAQSLISEFRIHLKGSVVDSERVQHLRVHRNLISSGMSLCS